MVSPTMLRLKKSARDTEPCMSKMCQGGGTGDGEENEDTRLVMDGGVLDEVQQFCYSTWEICWIMRQGWREHSEQ